MRDTKGRYRRADQEPDLNLFTHSCLLFVHTELGFHLGIAVSQGTG